jgi:hypothetical protein
MDRLQERLLPVADAFMAMMWSRPSSGSLRDTRVTLATMILGAAVVIAVGIPAAVLVVYALVRLQPLLLVPGVLCLLLALGALSVTLFGMRQRLLERRSG